MRFCLLCATNKVPKGGNALIGTVGLFTAFSFVVVVVAVTTLLSGRVLDDGGHRVACVCVGVCLNFFHVLLKRLRKEGVESRAPRGGCRSDNPNCGITNPFSGRLNLNKPKLYCC